MGGCIDAFFLKTARSTPTANAEDPCRSEGQLMTRRSGPIPAPPSDHDPAPQRWPSACAEKVAKNRSGFPRHTPKSKALLVVSESLVDSLDLFWATFQIYFGQLFGASIYFGQRFESILGNFSAHTEQPNAEGAGICSEGGHREWAITI